MAVYFIRAEGTGLVKIGNGRDPWRRLAMLQTGSANRLSMVGLIEGAREIEADLHGRFAGLRTSGEWFREDGDLADYIAQLEPPVRVSVRQSKRGVKTLAEAAGIGQPHASMIINGSRSPSNGLAATIYRVTGLKFGILKSATDEEAVIICNVIERNNLESPDRGTTSPVPRRG